jgi:hypothetical protein
VADSLRFLDLSMSVIKLLGRGEYVASFPGGDVTGHFGLTVSDYTQKEDDVHKVERLLRKAAAADHGNHSDRHKFVLMDPDPRFSSPGVELASSCAVAAVGTRIAISVRWGQAI